jgi:chemotaxis protein MotB
MARRLLLAIRPVAAPAIILVAGLLSACVSQSAYDELQAQHQQLQAQNQQLQGQLATVQAQGSFVEAGDFLFPAGGYRLSAAGKAELANKVVPRLVGLPYAKIVVYGYTDNTPVGSELQRAGINDNLTLSSRRAGAVVTFLIPHSSDEVAFLSALAVVLG